VKLRHGEHHSVHVSPHIDRDDHVDGVILRL
jgi:hypothetical protein